MGYIPNLVYGKGTSDKTRAKDKIQDEHRCLSFIFGSLKEISKEKGFMCNVLGRTVTVKVWIHYFIGDTEGNNKLLGQYPGNKEGVKVFMHWTVSTSDRPYHITAATLCSPKIRM